MGAQLSVCAKCAAELSRAFLDRIIENNIVNIATARQQLEARKIAHRRFADKLEKILSEEETLSDNCDISIKAPKMNSSAQNQMAMISRKRKFPYKPVKNFYCKYPKIYMF